MDQIPGAIGDLARVLGRRALPQAIDELELEALELVGGIARRQLRESLAASPRATCSVATRSRFRSVI